MLAIKPLIECEHLKKKKKKKKKKTLSLSLLPNDNIYSDKGNVSQETGCIKIFLTKQK